MVHYRLHTGETLYECNECDRKFSVKYCYKVHMDAAVWKFFFFVHVFYSLLSFCPVLPNAPSPTLPWCCVIYVIWHDLSQWHARWTLRVYWKLKVNYNISNTGFSNTILHTFFLLKFPCNRRTIFFFFFGRGYRVRKSAIYLASTCKRCVKCFQQHPQKKKNKNKMGNEITDVITSIQ